MRFVVDGPTTEVNLAALIQTAPHWPIDPVRQLREERAAAMAESGGWNEENSEDMRARFEQWRARRLGNDNLDNEQREEDDEEDDEDDDEDLPELLDYEEAAARANQEDREGRYETTDARLRRIAVEDLSEVVAVVVVVVLSLRGVVLY